MLRHTSILQHIQMYVNTPVNIDNLSLRGICILVFDWRITHDRHYCQQGTS